MLGDGEPLGQIEVVPEEIRAAQGVAAEGSELASLRAVATIALSGARIDGRHKRVGIEPLTRACLGHVLDCMVLIERHAGNYTRKLGTTALHNTISIR